MTDRTMAWRHGAVAWALMAACGLGAADVRAELTQNTATGFIVNHRAEVSVTPEVVWKAVLQLPQWWNGRHTYSGQAGNLSLDAQAGGCWCERWGEGASVEHARVLMVMPGRVLRLSGGLGPLQDLGVTGILNIATSQQDGKNFLRMNYRVTGHADAGLQQLGPVVDGVIAEQFKRLKALSETGKAD